MKSKVTFLVSIFILVFTNLPQGHSLTTDSNNSLSDKSKKITHVNMQKNDCKVKEFENCKIKASLTIQKAYSKDSQIPDKGFLCVKYNAKLTNISSHTMNNIRGYFVMNVYLKETFTKKYKSGWFILADDSNIPFSFPPMNFRQKINLKPGQIAQLKGEECEVLAATVDTALVHLKKISKEPKQFTFVLNSFADQKGKVSKYDDNWLLDLCTLGHVSWAITHNTTFDECRQRSVIN